MAARLWIVALALAALFLVDRGVRIGNKVGFLENDSVKSVRAHEDRYSPGSPHTWAQQTQPICEHMAESPACPQTYDPVCGTDGVTYESECNLCLTRIKTRQDIQIVKDGKC